MRVPAESAMAPWMGGKTAPPAIELARKFCGCKEGAQLTRDTHDQDTCTAAGVAAEVRSSESEESGVHRCLEEEDGDQDTDCSVAFGCANDCIESDGNGGVDPR